MTIPELTGTSTNLSKVMKHYQFPVFYERERALWNENSIYKDELPLQLWLYYNRLEYLDKSPYEISDMELMRGFTISGILKGYTVFRTDLMDEAVQTYGIRSIYDPCAGWGERMLYCYCNDILYRGVDINEKLACGYADMMRDYQMTNQSIQFADSASIVLSGTVDAVVTCPPYGNTEIYTEKGAENLSPDEFLDWWKRVIENSLQLTFKYFCFQINQKWKQSMADVVESCGFRFIEEFVPKKVSSSHFTRRNGQNVKREYESMLVFEKK